jgi:hypothetical protein
VVDSSEFRFCGIGKNVGVDVISALEAGLGGRGGIMGLGDKLRVELGDPEPAEGYTLQILARGLWRDFGCIVELQRHVNTSVTF